MTDRLHNLDAPARDSLAATVLVVEADSALRGFLARLLERHGLSVLLASTPEQAQLILAREWSALGAIVHGPELLRGESRRHATRLAQQSPARPVLVYGRASEDDDAARDGGAPAGAPPFDGERLVRELLALMRAARERARSPRP